MAIVNHLNKFKLTEIFRAKFIYLTKYSNRMRHKKKSTMKPQNQLCQMFWPVTMVQYLRTDKHRPVKHIRWKV